MENTNQTPPSLTLNDLAVLRNVIEVAISRGTFKAEEISIVGQTYDKLKAWLETVAAQQAAAADQPTAEEPPAEQPAPAKKAATKSTATKQKGKK